VSSGYRWALEALKPRLEHYFTDHNSRRETGRGPDTRRTFKSRLKAAVAPGYGKILCVSDYVLDQVRANGQRAERIHHFVNTDRFRPNAAVRREVRQGLGLGEEFVAVTVAYLIKDKGVDVAVKALAQLPANAVLCVVGGGPELASLQALALDLGIEGRVRFLGPQRNVEPLMQAADCALCPSVWAEAAGLVNLEALACGLPVVASRIGGIPEFVVDGRNGLLFAPGRHDELAEAMRRLYDDLAFRERLGRKARSMAIERHSTQSLLADHLAIYRATSNR
jgi:glycosyltransferase involved in cell wall biosynthesis